MSRRRALPIATQKRVLHEAGYRCSVPTCRTLLTLDLHHLLPVALDGDDESANLLAVCPNCHRLHHIGQIPEDSLRAWKLLQVALNESFDRHSVELLLLVDKVPGLAVTGDGLVPFAALVAASFVVTTRVTSGASTFPHYFINLSDKGRTFVEGWKSGDQSAALAFVGA